MRKWGKFPMVNKIITKLQKAGYNCNEVKREDATKGLGVAVSKGQIEDTFTDIDSIDDLRYLVNLHLNCAKFHNQVERAHFLLDLYFCLK